MRVRPSIAIVLAAALLLLSASLCSAEIPLQMNYQVMLTNDMDEPLADQSVELVFTIHDAPSGGSQWWTETHNVMTNSIGVVSVVLGESNPLGIDFSSPLWLQIEVDGEPLTPRRSLTAAPYAMRAMVADTAESAGHASDSDNLGGIVATEYALREDLFVPGTINDSGNPVDWTMLKNVPGGFADGTDDVGTGVGGGGTADYVPKFTDGSTIQNSIIYESGGQVAIGTTTTGGKLTVENAGDLPTLTLTNTSSTTAYPVLNVSRTGDTTSGGSVLSLDATEASDGLFLDCTRVTGSGFYRTFWVDLDGGIYSLGEMDITSETDRVIDAYSNYESGDTRVLSGVYAPGGGGEHDAIGVYGESVPQDWYGCGGLFKGGYIGAEARVQPTGGGDYYGLVAYAIGGSGENYGVWADATGSGVNWAGYFAGDTRVTGTFVNPGPVLEIDHPADPENQYLRHALVASPEMKTVYDGTVVLDAAGAATVELPDWFEDLNGNFRYQLTPIGAPAPGLHIAETVADGRFLIAGGEPGMTVSWQVTGVRHDAHARHRPLVIEEAKRSEDRGSYITPEAHGAARESGIGHSIGKRME